MTSSLKDRIAGLLTAESSPLREAGAAVLVDHVLDRPLVEIIDLAEVQQIVLSAFTEDNVERVVSRHVRPGFERYEAAAHRTGETVGGLVPDDSVTHIRTIVKKSRLPRAKWAEGIVEPSLVRRLFAPVWAHLLLNFAKKMPVPGASAASGAAAAAGSAVGKGLGGVAGRLGKSAERFVGAGRAVMGGLGAEVEKRIQSAARDFSEGAQTMFRDALRDRLKSDEGKALVDQMSRQIVDHVLVTKLGDLHEDVKRMPMDDIFGAVPKIVAHAAKRPFVTKLVAEEVAAFVALEKDRPLRELLDEFGLLVAVRDLAVRRVSDLFRTAAATPSFDDWLGRLLEGA